MCIDRIGIYNPYCCGRIAFAESSTHWPRGFPLSAIRSERLPVAAMVREKGALITALPNPDEIGIIQSLADNDPDVDAIYRLTKSLPIDYFAQSSLTALDKGVFSPFNAQVWHIHILMKVLPIIGLFIQEVGILSNVLTSVSSWSGFGHLAILHSSETTVGCGRPIRLSRLFCCSG